MAEKYFYDVVLDWKKGGRGVVRIYLDDKDTQKLIKDGASALSFIQNIVKNAFGSDAQIRDWSQLTEQDFDHLSWDGDPENPARKRFLERNTGADNIWEVGSKELGIPSSRMLPPGSFTAYDPLKNLIPIMTEEEFDVKGRFRPESPTITGLKGQAQEFGSEQVDRIGQGRPNFKIGFTGGGGMMGQAAAIDRQKMGLPPIGSTGPGPDFGAAGTIPGVEGLGAQIRPPIDEGLKPGDPGYMAAQWAKLQASTTGAGTDFGAGTGFEEEGLGSAALAAPMTAEDLESRSGIPAGTFRAPETFDFVGAGDSELERQRKWQETQERLAANRALETEASIEREKYAKNIQVMGTGWREMWLGLDENAKDMFRKMEGFVDPDTGKIGQGPAAAAAAVVVPDTVTTADTVVVPDTVTTADTGAVIAEPMGAVTTGPAGAQIPQAGDMSTFEQRRALEEATALGSYRAAQAQRMGLGRDAPLPGGTYGQYLERQFDPAYSGFMGQVAGQQLAGAPPISAPSFEEWIGAPGRTAPGIAQGAFGTLEQMRGIAPGAAPAGLGEGIYDYINPRSAQATQNALGLLRAAQSAQYSPLVSRMFNPRGVTQEDVYADWARRGGGAGADPTNFLDFASGRFGLQGVA